jgi:hypothetical protein
MANPEHVKILKQGVNAWNKWMMENSEKIPDLEGADLHGADLEGVNLPGADLRGADLTGAKLTSANLFKVNLFGAIIREATLVMADLRKAELVRAESSFAHLTDADLTKADLTMADLTGADLSGASLLETDLRKAKLGGAVLRWAGLLLADLNGALLHNSDFTDAQVGGTVFGDNDLSIVKGLEAVRHGGPSTIGIDTIYKSKGNIPEVFLRGAGVPEDFILYMKSLARNPIEFYSCFISYSSKDDDFAQRLHADLQAKGVRCWFAPEDLKIGEKFRTRIDESIRIYDKVMVILSENSIRSPWVKEEVEAALEKEHKQNKLVLFPIRLDDAVMETDQAWAASLRRTRHIGDFRAWKDHDQYQKSFDRLLRDLKA